MTPYFRKLPKCLQAAYSQPSGRYMQQNEAERSWQSSRRHQGRKTLKPKPKPKSLKKLRVRIRKASNPNPNPNPQRNSESESENPKTLNPNPNP